MQGTQTNYIAHTDIQTYNPNLDLSLYTATTLSGIVTRASAWVDSYLGYTLTLETLTDEKQEGHVDADGNLVIFPAKFPVQSVSEIAITRAGTTLNLNLTDGATNRYDLVPSYSPTQIIYPNNQLSMTGSIRVNSFYELRQVRFFTEITYTAGYQTIPADIQDAVRLVSQELITRNINSTGATSVSQGEISYTYSDRLTGDSDNIKDAKQILSSYRKVTGF